MPALPGRTQGLPIALGGGRTVQYETAYTTMAMTGTAYNERDRSYFATGFVWGVLFCAYLSFGRRERAK
jgi:hypothetical protein